VSAAVAVAAEGALAGEFDLRGKTCMVTGASDGIGLAAATAFAGAGAEVVMVVRNEERGKAAAERIRAAHPDAKLDLELADLSSQAAIRGLGERYVASKRPLHVLVNNAGVWQTARKLSVDGIELTFATNMLGYFLVTKVLEPALVRSAPSRMVAVGSGLAGGLDFDDINFDKRSWGAIKPGVAAYAQSKQANRMWTWALARKLAGTGVTANIMNPNNTRTGAFKKGGGPLAWIVHFGNLFVSESAAKGADTAVWLAASTELDGVTGKYWEKRKECECAFRDPAKEDAVWELCERLTSASATPAA
jgi:NAD(P)-dependent dehydrogenase (short-subunit alcohol dehydrogenase family)